jgi:tetratricopeptide (TPR) repeat protein
MSHSQKTYEQGVKLFRQGKNEAALEKFKEALAQATGDSLREAEIYNDIGVVYKQLGDYPAAYAALNEATSRFERLDNEKVRRKPWAIGRRYMKQKGCWKRRSRPTNKRRRRWKMSVRVSWRCMYGRPLADCE